MGSDRFLTKQNNNIRAFTQKVSVSCRLTQDNHTTQSRVLGTTQCFQKTRLPEVKASPKHHRFDFFAHLMRKFNEIIFSIVNVSNPLR